MKSKIFPFVHKKIFQPLKVIQITFNKTVYWYKWLFPNFSAGISFSIFDRFSNVRFSDRCHLINDDRFQFYCLKNVYTAILNFLFYRLKIRVFVNLEFITI